MIIAGVLASSLFLMETRAAITGRRGGGLYTHLKIRAGCWGKGMSGNTTSEAGDTQSHPCVQSGSPPGLYASHQGAAQA